MELRIGVSSCLLGKLVRYDGGHKKNAFIMQSLAPFVSFLSICPEVEAGMGVPRPSLRFESQSSSDKVRLVEVKTKQDHTETLTEYAHQRCEQNDLTALDGYILKSKSPSCGMERVKIYQADANRSPSTQGQGIFAKRLCERFTHLPIEEEGRLEDAHIRENFIERIFIYHRLRKLFELDGEAINWQANQVIQFHSRHKLQLMAHCNQSYRELGRLVANIKTIDRQIFQQRYIQGLMQAMTKIATRGQNTNVLQHASGYLKPHLDATDRQELSRIIEDYRLGLLPLIVPITLLQFFVKRFQISYLQDQYYLDPHPKELMLRNHV